MAFVFYVVVARVLDPKEVGRFSLLLMVLTVFNTISLLGLNNAVIKYVSENLGKGDEEYALASAREAFKVLLFVSIVALAVGFSFSPVIGSYIGVGVIEVLIILTTAFILNITSYYGALMYGYSMFKEVSVQNILYTTIGRFSGILFTLFCLSVLGLILGLLVGSIVTLFYSILILKGKVRRTNKRFPAVKLLAFSMPVYGANIIGLSQNWLDIAVLSGIAGLSVTGVYFIAVSSVGVLSILWTPLSSALFPTFSWINGTGNKEGINVMHIRIIRLATAVILPLSVSLAAVSRTAISVVYGEKYLDAGVPFMILSVLVILSAYSGIYFAELQAAGRTKPIFIEGLISAMVYLMLLLSLTMWLKQIGAAIARALMVITAFVILYNSIKMKMPDNIMKSIIMSIVMAFILSLVESFLNVSLYAKALIEALNFCNSVASLL